MQFHIVGPDDVELLTDLFTDIDREFFRPHPFTPRAAREIANRRGRDVHALLLDDGRPVAYGMLRGWDEGYATPSLGIAVRNDAQGRGYGRLMMAHLHAEALRAGSSDVRLRVHARNLRARRLYESLGYEYAGTERGEDVMVLRLRGGPNPGSAEASPSRGSPADEPGAGLAARGQGARGGTVQDGIVPLLIVGAGGFGREVLELVRDVNRERPTFDPLGFLDDGSPSEDLLGRVGAALLGTTARLADLAAAYVIAIGAAGPRRRIDEIAASHGRTAATLVHPWATVGNDVGIGDGAIIAAGTRLTTHVVVGRHAHVNFNCTVGHDTVIGDFATLFPGVHVSGGCVIEENATLGTGSVILPDVRVGRGAVVGAGAIVVRDVAPGTTVVGTPARPTLGHPSGDAGAR